MTSSTLPHKYLRVLVPISNVGYLSIIGSMRLLEGQTLLKCQSPFNRFDNGVGARAGSASPFLERYYLTFPTDALMYCADTKSYDLGPFSITTWRISPPSYRDGGPINSSLSSNYSPISFRKDIFGFVRNDQAIINIKKHIFIVLCSICMGVITHPYIGIIQAWFKSQVIHTDF